MLDHLDLHVKDIERSKAFYEAVLAPLGGKLLSEEEAGLTFQTGQNLDGYLWLETGEPYPFHFAFQAQTNAEVDAFNEAALLHGGKGNGAPGYRNSDQEFYYAAYIIDPDGYRIEAVCHTGKEK